MQHRILLVAGFFPPYSPLGAVRAPMLARWWSQQGHDVRVIALENPAVAGQLEHCLAPEAVRYIPFSPPAPVLRQAADSAKVLLAKPDSRFKPHIESCKVTSVNEV